MYRVFVSRYEIDAESDRPVSQPADLGPRRDDESVCDKSVRAATGSLIWVSGMMRPDITNVIRAAARQDHDPDERHWRTVRKIIPNLNKTKDLVLAFVKDGHLELITIMIGVQSLESQ